MAYGENMVLRSDCRSISCQLSCRVWYWLGVLVLCKLLLGARLCHTAVLGVPSFSAVEIVCNRGSRLRDVMNHERIP